MAKNPAISVIVHTQNSAATLAKTLATVGWADEVVVIDMASEDETRALAAAAGARVLSIDPYPRVDGVRTRLLSAAAHEWIFVIDSDEHLAADAPAAVAELISNHATDYDAFAIPRFNYFAGQVLKGSGWYPDHQIRLFRSGTVRWADATHRSPELLTGRLKIIQPPQCMHIHHTNYVDLAHVICKQAQYARNDVYPDDTQRFSFEAYVAEAYTEYFRRQSRETDGDYSNALAVIMAWDKIIRGLIHWDRLGRKPELPDVYSLPVVITNDRQAEIDGLMNDRQAEIDRLNIDKGALLIIENDRDEEIHNLKAEIERINAEKRALQSYVDAVMSSKFWKLTLPVRALIDTMRQKRDL